MLLRLESLWKEPFNPARFGESDRTVFWLEWLRQVAVVFYQTVEQRAVHALSLQSTKSKPQKLSYPKALRLKSRADFLSVFADSRSENGRIFRGQIFSFFVSRGKKAADHPRFGISVSKKNLRKAHDRNQLKRWLREWFRHHQHELNGSCVVRWDGKRENLSREQISKELERFLNKQKSWANKFS